MSRSSLIFEILLYFMAMLAALAMVPPEASAVSREYYYVNTSNTSLYNLPLYTSEITGSVQLNDRVEKLGDSPKGWTKVKNPRNGTTGWLSTRYLSARIVSPRPAAASPRKRLKQAPASKPTPPPEEPAPAVERPKPM